MKLHIACSKVIRSVRFVIALWFCGWITVVLQICNSRYRNLPWVSWGSSRRGVYVLTCNAQENYLQFCLVSWSASACDSLFRKGPSFSYWSKLQFSVVVKMGIRYVLVMQPCWFMTGVSCCHKCGIWQQATAMLVLRTVKCAWAITDEKCVGYSAIGS